MRGVAVPPGSGQRDLAQLAGIGVIALSGEIVRRRPPLRADLADAPVHTRGLDDPRTFLDLQRERLLDVDVLTGIERIALLARNPSCAKRTAAGLSVRTVVR